MCRIIEGNPDDVRRCTTTIGKVAMSLNSDDVKVIFNPILGGMNFILLNLNIAYMNQRSISYYDLIFIADYAASKYSYIENEEEMNEAVFDFIQTYINGGKFVVYNSINQFLADFDVLDDAIYYKEENEPKNELFSIECEILN